MNLKMTKVILVTGSARGLGRYLVEAFAEKGFRVYAGVRNPEDLGSPGWPKGQPLIRVLKIDVTRDDDCREAIKRVAAESGRLDVLVNNAAKLLVGPSASFTPADYLGILDTIAVGSFRLTREALPLMASQENGGKIINVTSLNGRVSLPNFGLYSSAKFALEALGLAWRYELKRKKIWVTNVAPGAINHPMAVSEKLPHVPAREKFRLLRKLLPMLTVAEVATAIVKIAENPRPPAQVLLGRDSQITVFLQRILPQAVWDALLTFIWS